MRRRLTWGGLVLVLVLPAGLSAVTDAPPTDAVASSRLAASARAVPAKTLRVKVVQPPNGRARVLVNGPRGFRKVVRRSVALTGLRPGTYRVSARAAESRKWIAKPVISKTRVRVTGTRGASVRVSYAKVVSKIVVSVSAGGSHTCAVRDDGSAWCWGYSDAGALGDGTTATALAPVRVRGADDWATVSAAINTTCGVRRGGTGWCWGFQALSGDSSSTPVPVEPSNDWKSLSTGAFYLTCGLRRDATAWCGWMGEPRVPVDSFTNWTSVYAGAHNACGTRTDGSAWCWGANDRGNLGDGTTEPRATPVRVVADNPWLSVSVSQQEYQSCGVQSGGSAWCWGGNPYGLGVEGATYSLTPARVGPPTGWTDVSLGGYHACGLRADGSIWCWGSNHHGELGDGTRTHASVPVRVQSTATFVSVSAGGVHTCAIDSTGTAWCWGLGGLLGHGKHRGSAVPVRVAS
jgi:hypothetical protein